jgi:hypothetical protein
LQVVYSVIGLGTPYNIINTDLLVIARTHVIKPDIVELEIVALIILQTDTDYRIAILRHNEIKGHVGIAFVLQINVLVVCKEECSFSRTQAVDSKTILAFG